MRTIAELMSMDGRVAVITGGAGHIGRAMAAALAELGAHIVLVDVEAERCEEATRSLSAQFGVRGLPLVLDLADEKAVREIPARVHREHGRMDILINNAALVGTSELKGWGVPFDKQRADTWRMAIEVNLTVPFVLSQAAAPLLRASGHGTIINVGSIYGVVGPNMSLYADTEMGNPAAYAASKGGLLQLTRWLATALAPSVRVNAITPGGVSRGQDPRFTSRYEALTPLGRMATEEDFMGAVVYLASDMSSYTTGQNMMVDGGWTAW